MDSFIGILMDLLWKNDGKNSLTFYKITPSHLKSQDGYESILTACRPLYHLVMDCCLLHLICQQRHSYICYMLMDGSEQCISNNFKWCLYTPNQHWNFPEPDGTNVVSCYCLIWKKKSFVFKPILDLLPGLLKFPDFCICPYFPHQMEQS
jgi:hypothetical protein